MAQGARANGHRTNPERSSKAKAMDRRVEQHAAAQPEHADEDQPGHAMHHAQAADYHAQPVEPASQAIMKGVRAVSHGCCYM